MKRVVFAFGLLLFGVIMQTSCTKNDEYTIVPIGDEHYIVDIDSLFSNTSIFTQRFWNDFGDIRQYGYIPPKIEGSYVVNPKDRMCSNVSANLWPLTVKEPNMYLRFEKQHNELVTLDWNEIGEIATDTVFVRGNGKDFAIYYIENQITPYNSIKSAYIMRGRITDEGIADFRYATIILDALVTDVIIDIGHYFIYKDGDGIAQRVVK